MSAIGLRMWMARQGYSPRQVARRLGVSRPAVQRWLQGVRLPGLRAALALERLTGGAVPARSWLAATDNRASVERAP
jgi:transcriptional regulator with XRE-family HTH domain